MLTTQPLSTSTDARAAADAVTGMVFDIRRFSIHDGPGLRTTVFFKGCPLRCYWCHNPESQHHRRELLVWPERCIGCQSCIAACPKGAITWNGSRPVTDLAGCTLTGACVQACYAEARQIAGRAMSVAQVMSEVVRDRSFYETSGGVTFSGGEPLLQAGFLLGLLEACRAAEIHTALDTCGFTTWETLDRLRSLVDLFLYDIKLIDPVRHRKYTLVFNARILENLRHLAELGHDIIVRVPIIPGINDDASNLHQTAAFAAGLGGLMRLDLLPYHRAAAGKYERLHRNYRLPKVQTPSDEYMQRIARLFEGYGLQVHIGG